MKPLTTAAAVATAVALSVAGAQNGREIKQNRLDQRELARNVRQ